MAASKLSFEEEIKELLDVQDDVNLPNMAASKLSFEEEIKELHAFFFIMDNVKIGLVLSIKFRPNWTSIVHKFVH